MLKVPTPHINAHKGDFAKTVIMPGDPLRAKYIAKTYLTDINQVNSVRGMLAFTGIYKGKKVSVMASGMGMPSMGIYCYELFNGYGVENIIRTGTAGSISNDLNINDIIVANCAVTNSAFAHQYTVSVSNACSKLLLESAVNNADKQNIKITVAPIFTSDILYFDNDEDYSIYISQGAKAVDMETAALYFTANRFCKNAISICSVSDSIITGEATTSRQREQELDSMIKLALEISKEI